MTENIKMNGTETKKNAGAKKKKRGHASLDKRKARAGWIFVAPFVVGFLFIYFPIVLQSIKLSFFTMETLAGGGYTLEWVGFEFYRKALFVNPKFVQTLVTGIGDMIFEIPAIIIFSLFMAVLLNQKMAGRAFFRAIFFIPVILSTGIMESINSANILDEYMDEGISDGTEASATDQIASAMDIQALFSGMAVGSELAQIVADWVNRIFQIVNRSGVQMLIFLAGLQSISPAIYESCQIDGASSWETFWKITFPMISPMILVNGVYTIIDSFTTDSNSVMKFIANKYTQTNGNVISSAMSWVYFLIVMLIVGIVAAIFSSVVFYQKKD